MAPTQACGKLFFLDFSPRSDKPNVRDFRVALEGDFFQRLTLSTPVMFHFYKKPQHFGDCPAQCLSWLEGASGFELQKELDKVSAKLQSLVTTTIANGSLVNEANYKRRMIHMAGCPSAFGVRIARGCRITDLITRKKIALKDLQCGPARSELTLVGITGIAAIPGDEIFYEVWETCKIEGMSRKRCVVNILSRGLDLRGYFLPNHFYLQLYGLLFD